MSLNPVLIQLALKQADSHAHERSQPKPPTNYRLALGAVSTCASCKHFIPGQNFCDRFKWPVERDGVCDEYDQKQVDLPDEMPPVPGGGGITPEQPGLVMTGMPQAPTAGPLKMATDGLDSIWGGVDQGPVVAAPLKKDNDRQSSGSPNPTTDESVKNQDRPPDEYQEEAMGDVNNNPKATASIFSMLGKAAARDVIKSAGMEGMKNFFSNLFTHPSTVGRNTFRDIIQQHKDSGNPIPTRGQAHRSAVEGIVNNNPDLLNRASAERRFRHEAKQAARDAAQRRLFAQQQAALWTGVGALGTAGLIGKGVEMYNGKPEETVKEAALADPMYQYLFGGKQPMQAPTPKLTPSPVTGDKLHDYLFSQQAARPQQPRDLYQYLFGDKSLQATKRDLPKVKTAGNMGLYSNASISPQNLKPSPIQATPNAAQSVMLPQAKPLVGAQPGDPTVPQQAPANPLQSQPAGPRGPVKGPKGVPNTPPAQGAQAQPEPANQQQPDPTQWKPSPLLTMYPDSPHLSTYSQFVPPAPPPDPQMKMGSEKLVKSLGDVAAKVAMASGVASAASKPKMATPASKPKVPQPPRPKMPKMASVVDERSRALDMMLSAVAGGSNPLLNQGGTTKSADNQVGVSDLPLNQVGVIKSAAAAGSNPLLNQVDAGHESRSTPTIITVYGLPAADTTQTGAQLYTKRANMRIGTDAFDPLSIDMTIPADPKTLLARGGVSGPTVEQRSMIERTTGGQHPGIKGRDPGRSTGYLDPDTLQDVRDATAGARTTMDIGGEHMPHNFFDHDRFQTLAQMAAAGDTRAYSQMKSMTDSLESQGLDPATARMARLRMKDLALQHPQFDKSAAAQRLGELASNLILAKLAAWSAANDEGKRYTPAQRGEEPGTEMKSDAPMAPKEVIESNSKHLPTQAPTPPPAAPEPVQPTPSKGQQPVPVQPPANQVAPPPGFQLDAQGNMIPDQAMHQKWQETGRKTNYGSWAQSWNRTGQAAEDAKRARQAGGYVSPKEQAGMTPQQVAQAKQQRRPGAAAAQPTQTAGAGQVAGAQNPQMAGAGRAGNYSGMNPQQQVAGMIGGGAAMAGMPQQPGQGPAQTNPMQNPTVGGQPVPHPMMGNQRNAMAMAGRMQRPMMGRTQGRQMNVNPAAPMPPGGAATAGAARPGTPGAAQSQARPEALTHARPELNQLVAEGAGEAAPAEQSAGAGQSRGPSLVAGRPNPSGSQQPVPVQPPANAATPPPATTTAAPQTPATPPAAGAAKPTPTTALAGGGKPAPAAGAAGESKGGGKQLNVAAAPPPKAPPGANDTSKLNG